MFAGVLNGHLVAGGGSQFPQKPLWLNGAKAYTDRIFVLPALQAHWAESTARLPRPMAHFAFAAASDGIFLAGGCNASGVLREALVVRPQGAGYAADPLPDLPEPRVYAAGMVAGRRFFVAGGQAALGPKVAAASVWSLDLDATAGGWRREPDLPEGVFVGAMGEQAGWVYFIGGVGFDGEGRAVQSRRAYRLAPGGSRWESLPEMPEPRVGAVAPVPVIDGRLFVVGGYATAFKGEPREHPGFARRTFLYDLGRGAWCDGPVLPQVSPADRDASGDAGPAPMVAAAGAVWQGHYVVVAGEVRASVRTPAVIGLPLGPVPLP